MNRLPWSLASGHHPFLNTREVGNLINDPPLNRMNPAEGGATSAYLTPSVRVRATSPGQPPEPEQLLFMKNILHNFYILKEAVIDRWGFNLEVLEVHLSLV